MINNRVRVKQDVMRTVLRAVMKEKGIEMACDCGRFFEVHQEGGPDWRWKGG